MTREQKDYLLKDLCSRLPYGVKGKVLRRDCNNRECEFVATIDGKLYDKFAVTQESWYDNVTIRPYLRPMSSMTGVEILEYLSLKESIVASDNITYSFETYESIDWLNKNMFDYHGLIPMGLAIDATGLNIY